MHINLKKKLISVDDNFRNFGGFKSYRLLRPAKGTTYKNLFLDLLIDMHTKTLSNLMPLMTIFQKDALSHYFGSSDNIQVIF